MRLNRLSTITLGVYARMERMTTFELQLLESETKRATATNDWWAICEMAKPVGEMASAILTSRQIKAKTGKKV